MLREHVEGEIFSIRIYSDLNTDSCFKILGGQREDQSNEGYFSLQQLSGRMNTNQHRVRNSQSLFESTCSPVMYTC